MREVPDSLYDAILSWSGAEPSQSVLAREVDKWLATGDAYLSLSKEYAKVLLENRRLISRINELEQALYNRKE